MNNEEIIKIATGKLKQVPHIIKDIFLLVNCHSVKKFQGGHDVGGSMILTVRGTPDMTGKQKMILLAEMIKRMDLTPDEMSEFYHDIRGKRKDWMKPK